MTNNKSLLGAVAGASIAVVWVAFDGGAALLMIALAIVGWSIGMIFERPDIFINLLQRLQER
ncbi:MAG: hypothetical protein OEW91_09035 [Acidimicrobiia bacterium]|nr:hypothetical protein [Acidimicrobiia bacterium]